MSILSGSAPVRLDFAVCGSAAIAALSLRPFAAWPAGDGHRYARLFSSVLTLDPPSRGARHYARAPISLSPRLGPARRSKEHTGLLDQISLDAPRYPRRS